MPATTKSPSRATATLQSHVISRERNCRLVEMENDTMLFMERLHESAHFRTQNSFQRSFFRRHDMNFNPTAAQGCRNLKPDEACTKNDRSARRLGARDDGATICKRAKRMNVVSGRSQESKDEPAQLRSQAATDHTELCPIGERHLPRALINAGNVRGEPQVNGVFGIERFRPERYPIFRSIAGEIVF